MRLTGGFLVVFCMSVFLAPFLVIGAALLPEDERWEVLNPEIEGVDGAIYAMAWYDDQLCIGGDFTVVRNIPAPGIACLDLLNDVWSSPGSPLKGYVFALASDRNGGLYAAGSSSTDGSSYVARWDGQKWDVVANDVNGTVRILVSDSNGLLYAGGDFYTVAGVSASKIALWDGTNWAPVGANISSMSQVYDMAVDAEDRLYVVGDGYKNNFARWDGNSWQLLGEGVNGTIYDLLIHGNDIYVAGNFTDAGNIPASNIARWDGAQWHTVGDGIAGTISHIEFDSQGTLYAAEGSSSESSLGFQTQMSFFDGTQWQSQGDIIEGGVMTFAFDENDILYLGGNFISLGDRAAASLLRGKDGEWETLGKPGIIEHVFAITTTPEAGLYVSDNKLRAIYSQNYVYLGRVKKLTETGWEQVGEESDMQILTLEMRDDVLYAGGMFSKIGATAASLIARWDGSSWQPLAEELLGEWVADLESYGEYIYGVGSGLHTAQKDIGTGRWDGTSWEALSNDIPYGGLSIAFDSAGVPYIASMGDIFRLVGGIWQKVGESFSWMTMAIAFDGADVLYAGGYFEEEIDNPTSHVARWDGTQWQIIGEMEHSVINTLAADRNGDVFVGGSFSEIDGVAAKSIARWDGTSWHPVGSAVDGDVYRLKIGDDRRLYVGGRFSTAGGKFSPNIAAYKLDELPDEGTPDDDSIIGSDEEQSDSDTIISTPDGDGGNVTDTETPTDEDTKSNGTGCGCTVVME